MWFGKTSLTGLHRPSKKVRLKCEVKVILWFYAGRRDILGQPQTLIQSLQPQCTGNRTTTAINEPVLKRLHVTMATDSFVSTS